MASQREVGAPAPINSDLKGTKMNKNTRKLNRPILAEGETTGHKHVIDDQSVEVAEREDKAREFKLAKPATVKHEEHNPVTLPAGEYVSDIVRECDPFEGERRVLD